MGKIKDNGLFEMIFHAVPLPIFRVDEEVEILDMNRAAQKMFNTSPAQALRRRGGDILGCINAVGAAKGCGKEVACLDCVIRNTVIHSYRSGQEVIRQPTMAEVFDDDGAVQKLSILLTVAPISSEGDRSIILCIEDITELVRLRSMIPICSNCKKIRDDQQLWESVEEYFSKFIGVDFTHSICPDCAKELYGEFLDD